jgi:hypothetical protein
MQTSSGGAVLLQWAVRDWPVSCTPVPLTTAWVVDSEWRLLQMYDTPCMCRCRSRRTLS